MMRLLRFLMEQPWGRFLRQLATLIGALVGLVLLAWLGVILYAGYWLPDMKGFTYDDRTVAVDVALGIHKISEPTPCEGASYSRDNPACLKLSRTNNQLCRWWLLEGCQPYVASDIVLTDKNLAGAMMNAVINPCNYWLRAQENQHRACHENSMAIPGLFSSPHATLYPIAWSGFRALM